METPDPLLTCPYNKAHTLLKSRMQYHLKKCRKQYPNSVYGICPFDSTHHIPEPEMEYHVEECPNRRVFDDAKYVTADSKIMKAELPSYIQPAVPSYSENWDDCDVSSSYQPSVKAEEAPVLRTLHGGTKSERKAFRHKERLRVQELQDKGYFDENHSATHNIPPLRLPANFIPGSFNPELASKTETSSSNSSSASDASDLPCSSVINLETSRGSFAQGAGDSSPSKAVNVSATHMQRPATSAGFVTSVLGEQTFSYASSVGAKTSGVGRGSSARAPNGVVSHSDNLVTEFRNLSLSRGRGISRSLGNV